MGNIKFQNCFLNYKAYNLFPDEIKVTITMFSTPKLTVEFLQIRGKVRKGPGLGCTPVTLKAEKWEGREGRRERKDKVGTNFNSMYFTIEWIEQ